MCRLKIQGQVEVEDGPDGCNEARWHPSRETLTRLVCLGPMGRLALTTRGGSRRYGGEVDVNGCIEDGSVWRC
jgi:hypothetical protein